MSFDRAPGQSRLRHVCLAAIADEFACRTNDAMCQYPTPAYWISPEQQQWETGTVIGQCELCTPNEVVAEDGNAYVRYDSNRLTRGHVIVVPKRHVANYFEMTSAEKVSIITLLDESKEIIERQFSPDGYNIGVNVGKAAGQSRMHVHIHLIPRYRGDVADPGGGIRCVLSHKPSAPA